MKIQWKSMPSPEKAKGKEKSGKGKKGGKKGKRKPFRQRVWRNDNITLTIRG